MTVDTFELWGKAAGWVRNSPVQEEFLVVETAVDSSRHRAVELVRTNDKTAVDLQDHPQDSPSN